MNYLTDHTNRPFPSRASTARPRFFALLLIMPLLTRLVLGAVTVSKRSYTEPSMGALLTDPSVISFALSTFILFFSLTIHSLIEMFRMPLVLLVLYAGLGTAFGVLGATPLLCLFVGYELFVYYVISAISVTEITHGGEICLHSLEKTILFFFSAMICIAVLDLLLPTTAPFLVQHDGRRRFSGQIIRLEAIQWAVVAAVTFLLAFGIAIRRKGRRIALYAIGIMSLVILYVTRTRGALLGVGVAYVYQLFYMWKEAGLALKLGMLYLLLTGISFVILLHSFGDYSVVLSSLRLGDTQNLAAMGGRTALWEGVLLPLLSNPFKGYGIGIRAWHIAGFGSGSMHNFFLEAWRGAGLIGALLFLLALMLVGVRLFRSTSKVRITSESANSRNEEVVSIRRTAFSIFVYVAMHSCVESSIAGVNNFLFLAFLYCLVVAQSSAKLEGYANAQTMIQRNG